MHGLPVDADSGPPLGLPLRFFLTGLVFLIAAATVGVLDAAGLMPGLGRVAHTHLLLAGWACLTILGAMAQFVPTWSGERLEWPRLVEAAFPLVAVGVAGLALGMSLELLWLLPLAGGLAATGFWLFVAAMGRTLLAVRPLDVTEAHFTVAIAALAVVPLLGLLLAFDLSAGLLGAVGLSHASVLGAHATLAVFGIVLVTILGALLQLATMFTQTEPTPLDDGLLRVEQATLPLGVVLLATGRLVVHAPLVRVGIGLVAVGLITFAVVLARLLLGAAVDYTPMHPRYGVVAASMIGWTVLAAPAILSDPLAASARFGAPGARSLLFLGVIGFTLLGTLYHVIPFLVWMDRYADLVGLEPIPAIDELYLASVARFDFVLTVGGLPLVVVGESIGHTGVVSAGHLLFLAGVILAVGNFLRVVVRHVIGAPTESGDRAASRE